MPALEELLSATIANTDLMAETAARSD